MTISTAAAAGPMTVSALRGVPGAGVSGDGAAGGTGVDLAVPACAGSGSGADAVGGDGSGLIGDGSKGMPRVRQKSSRFFRLVITKG
jgi:hypothetical protein